MGFLQSSLTGRRRLALDSTREASREPVLDSVVPFQRSGNDDVRPGSWLVPAGRAHRYRILERVAAGAEGVVFRAEMLAGPGSTGITVAIKQYKEPPDASPNWPHDGTWTGIARQAAFLSGLPKNDHLVWIREVFLGTPDSAESGHRRDVPFVVMDWLNGSAPTATMSRTTKALVRRTRYVEDLAEALAVLHSDRQRNPLAHSDLKPGNCLITDDRGLVLLDLGGLHLIAAGTSGRAPYTPPYAAPEVLTDPHRAREPAADMYSLGATAFWFVTGEEPPGPAEGDAHLAAAEARLRACRALRRPLTRHPRRRFIKHLLAGMAADPAVRMDLEPAKWAKRLRRLARRPLVRRRIALVTAVITLATGWSWHSGLLPFGGPEAYDLERQVVHWALLPTDSIEAQQTGYTADLASAVPLWARGAHNGVVGQSTRQGLLLETRRDPRPAVFSMSDPTGGSREVVEATGTISSGQGAWGVWCRGTTQTGTKRYRFLLTHAGAVGIFSYDAGGRGAPREEGTGWWYLTGIDVGEPVRMTAHCSDVPAEQQIGLRLSINGRTVLTHNPGPQAILTPGYSGFETYAFTDVDGPTLTAVLHSFRTAAPTTQ